MTQLLRLQPVLSRTGQSRTQHYNGIAAGLMTRPVSIGARAVAWPSHEVDAIITARIAGRTDDEIRALVRKLEADRQREAEEADRQREAEAGTECTVGSRQRRGFGRSWASMI